MSIRFHVAVFAVLLLSGSISYAETPLERGTYLMNSVVACGNCHTPQTPQGPVENMELAGRLLMDIAPFTAYAPNITPDKETGIGNWTNDQIIAAIREGRRPDGTRIGPPMPIEFYRGISDSDVRAIVAYLRSVPPVNNLVERSTYNIPLPSSYGEPVGDVADVSRDDPVEYGAYLTGALGHCWACHTPIVNGMLDLENQMGAGGQVLDGAWGVSVSANITPHRDGIGDYSDEDIVQAITRGQRPDGSALAPPMGFYYYSNIAEDDLAAMITYLRTVEPKASP